MSWIIRVILIAVISHFSAPYAPWWVVMVAGFLVCFIVDANGSLSAFSAGFLAIGLLWCVQCYLIDVHTEGILTDKITQLLGLSHRYWIIGITSLVGGVAAGFGCVLGQNTRALFKNKRKTYY